MKFTIDKNTNLDVLAHDMAMQILGALKNQIGNINKLIEDGENNIDLEIHVNLKSEPSKKEV